MPPDSFSPRYPAAGKGPARPGVELATQSSQGIPLSWGSTSTSAGTTGSPHSAASGPADLPDSGIGTT